MMDLMVGDRYDAQGHAFMLRKRLRNATAAGGRDAKDAEGMRDSIAPDTTYSDKSLFSAPSHVEASTLLPQRSRTCRRIACGLPDRGVCGKHK
jgi:hypothetical protein